MKTFLCCIAWVGVLFISQLPSAGQEEQTKSKHHRLTEWLQLLSPEEQSKFRAARHEAQKDPAVRSANDRRKRADAEYHQLLHARMLKIDPSLKPLLDKLTELKKPDI